jgi:ribonuclease HI
MHRALIHELFLAAMIRLSKIETSQAMRFHPTWQSRLKMEIVRSVESVLEQDRLEMVRFQIYVDGLGYEGGIGMAAVLIGERQATRTLAMKLGSPEEDMVYEAEAVGVLLALQLVLGLEELDKVVISIDNQAVIQATQSLRPMPGHYLVDKIHQLMARILVRWPALSVVLRWVPGHKGVIGNDMANEFAKQVAMGRDSEVAALPQLLQSSLPFSVSALKAYYDTK